MAKRSSEQYLDILHLPHHVSRRHPQMSLSDRAAQFSPFAALTGYGAAIQETARLTSCRVALDEQELEELNRRLTDLLRQPEKSPLAKITYFRPDPQKDGGAYVTVSGTVKKLDEAQRLLLLSDGSRIPLDEIVAIS